MYIYIALTPIIAHSALQNLYADKILKYDIRNNQIEVIKNTNKILKGILKKVNLIRSNMQVWIETSLIFSWKVQRSTFP